MMRKVLLLALACAPLAGCRHHQLRAPSDFAVLDEEGPFATRAVSADGVVIGVREIDNEPRATRAFWLGAIQKQLTDGRGYALLDRRDVRARSGQPGTQLRLGRDQNGEQYLYWLTLFVTKRRLYIVEAGARRDRFDPAQSKLEAALATLELKGSPF